MVTPAFMDVVMYSSFPYHQVLVDVTVREPQAQRYTTVESVGPRAAAEKHRSYTDEVQALVLSPQGRFYPDAQQCGQP